MRAAASTHVFAASLAVALLLSLAGCSSLRKTEPGVHDIKDQAAEYAEFGNRYFREGNYGQALSFFDQAFVENARVDNLPGIASCYNSIGKVYLATGDIQTAERNFLNALEIARDLESARLLLQSTTHLGEVALRRGELDTAMELFNDALEFRDDESDPADLAILYHDIGTVHSRQERYAQADQFLRDAIAINEEMDQMAELAANHYMLASVLSRQGRLPEAVTEAQTALDLDKLIENPVGITADLKALGLISIRRNDHEAAYDYMKRSLRVAAAAGLLGETVSLLGHLVEITTELGLESESDAYRAQLQELVPADDSSGTEQ